MAAKKKTARKTGRSKVKTAVKRVRKGPTAIAKKALKKYQSMRDFTVTAEPSGHRPVATATRLRYVIQKHEATRLHYDFRLEIDGVLKSWAIPKGPSLDPTLKHFAAHVEDHPIAYGDFEGNIPKGNYGAGSVMLWDAGTFELLGGVAADAQIARGDLKFRLHGEKLKGEFALVHMKNRGKGNEWLLIKKRDESAAPGWDIEAHAYSVLSGRTQEEIARNLPARESKRARAGASDRVWESSRPNTRSTGGSTAPAPATPKKKSMSTSNRSSRGSKAPAKPKSRTA